MRGGLNRKSRRVGSVGFVHKFIFSDLAQKRGRPFQRISSKAVERWDNSLAVQRQIFDEMAWMGLAGRLLPMAYPFRTSARSRDSPESSSPPLLIKSSRTAAEHPAR